MRVIYLGTPEFSVNPLKAILSVKGIEVIAVVCNKDKPVGRKQILTPPPVKVYANSVNIPVLQYSKIRLEGVEDLKKLNPDLMITCAFGQILSQEILDIPKLGTFNIHASLLPKFRGASPINYAILNGEKKTGITIMKTDAGIDTGDIFFSSETEIGDKETYGQLSDRLSVLGAEAIKVALNRILNNDVKLTKQGENASYTKMIKKEDALIDWNEDSKKIVNKIRAYNPSPVAYTFLNGEPLKIYSAEPAKISGEAGVVLKSDNELIVGCKNSAISVKVLQKAGGKQLNVSDFLRGNKMPVGTKFYK